MNNAASEIKQEQKDAPIDISEHIKSEIEDIKSGKDLKEVELDLTKEGIKKSAEEEESVKLSFKSGSFLKNQIKKSTGPAPEKEIPKTTVEDVKKEIEEYENKKDNFTYDDFYLLAEVIVDIIEIIIVSLLRWYAKDNSDAPYLLTQTKKDRIVKLLCKVLIKYQQKFSIEFLLFLTVVTAFMTSARKAHKHRQEVLKLQKENDENYNEDTKEVIVEKIVDLSGDEATAELVKKRGPKPKSIIEKPKAPVIPKKPRGAQSK
jgi:hypothetical protein